MVCGVSPLCANMYAVCTYVVHSIWLMLLITCLKPTYGWHSAFYNIFQNEIGSSTTMNAMNEFMFVNNIIINCNEKLIMMVN